MRPRSAGDKEYFPQDWFIDRLEAIEIPFTLSGRNSYPDFWVGDLADSMPKEGYEIKSLSFSGKRPARSDYDSNSTVPSGRKNECDVFLVFFLYTGTGRNPRTVHSLVIAHTNLINADHQIAGQHVNAGIPGFGSYANGNIRNRKMYRFPTPYTLEPALIGRCSLVVPASWSLDDDERLRKSLTVERTVASDRVRRYTIDLQDQANPIIETAPYDDAGEVRKFDVFEAA